MAGAVLAMSAGYRSDRVRSWLDPEQRPAGHRLPGPAGEVRAGPRRYLRRRPGPGHGQVELPAQRAQRLHLRDHRRGARLRRRVRAAGAVRAVRLHRDADRAPVGRPVPAAADRDHHDVGDRPGVHQHRLRDRRAAGHRHPAAADLGGWNINGHNAFHDRHDGERGSARTGGGGRAARRARRQDEPAAAAAAARALCADPARGVPRPQACPPATARPHRSRCRPQDRSTARAQGFAQIRSAAAAGVTPNSCRRRPAGSRLAGHHGLASATPAGQPASVSHGALEHWKVSVTGERHGQGADRRAGG